MCSENTPPNFSAKEQIIYEIAVALQFFNYKVIPPETYQGSWNTKNGSSSWVDSSTICFPFSSTVK